MSMRGVERRLENMVEGLFGRVFKSGIRPVEIGRKLIRALDDGRSVAVSGDTVVPNQFVVQLSPDDHAQFAEVEESLVRELCEAAREHAREEGYKFMGPLAVELVPVPGLRTGAVQIDGRLREAEGGHGAGSLLLPTGERVVLGEYLVTFGRLPECTITLADPNVSRNHAEIRPHANGFKLTDLGSTNGTKVNGVRIVEHVLSDGDILDFGTTRIVFEAS
ncbi:MAG: FHA domain-containing protein [Acidimicrobiia bacterium]|nr:FHA domain-containing protein [Acidimicrobiia bacterium]MDH5236517.1 FHA domain-containing protein [Acidimicrobiia bacterium]